MTALTTAFLLNTLLLSAQAHWLPHRQYAFKIPRRGSAAPAAESEELSLDDRVHAAMRRLGLEPPDESAIPENANSEGGVCTLTETESTPEAAPDHETDKQMDVDDVQDIELIAKTISDEYQVPKDIVMAAIYSSFSGEGEDMKVDEQLARNIVKAEVDAISAVSEDCDEVSWFSQISCILNFIY
jgi:hypothetical protein